MSKIIGNTTATPTPRSDWNQVDETKADFILNKPGTVTISQDGLMSAIDKVKLDGLENQVQSDWSQNNENASSYIKNKTHWADVGRVLLYNGQASNFYLNVPYEFDKNYYITLEDIHTSKVDEYQCTPWVTSMGEFGLGDSRVLDDFTHAEDVPFFIGAYQDDSQGTDIYNKTYEWYIQYNDPNIGYYTMRLEVEDPTQTVYHTLNENYIPDTVARKTYVDDAVTNVKDELLNGAGEAYDTLKELGDLIDENVDAIEALETVASGKADANHSHNYYGLCTTAAGTVAKTVDIANFQLVEGAMVIVKFQNSNSASNPTLNVSGTGAKPMYRYGTTALSTGTTTTGWYAGSVQVFVYDGTGWIRDYWNNTTYSNASLGNGYGTCTTAASTLAKTATLSNYALSTGGCVSIKFDNDVPANSTLNIASKGAKPMYYRGVAITDGIIKAGDVATFVYSTNYYLIAIDRWQEDIENLKADMDVALETKADWSQNNENASDYIKNRTHWAEEALTEFFPETTTPGFDRMDDSTFANLEGVYIVTVDGIAYRCETYLNSSDALSLGDSRINYADDLTNPIDVPFYIGYSEQLTIGGGSDGSTTATPYSTLWFADEGTHTIKIEKMSGTTYHTLDVNYIPELITVDDIDTICGGAIQYAEDVMF